jgi:hypothetical protein
MNQWRLGLAFLLLSLALIALIALFITFSPDTVVTPADLTATHSVVHTPVLTPSVSP